MHMRTWCGTSSDNRADLADIARGVLLCVAVRSRNVTGRLVFTFRIWLLERRKNARVLSTPWWCLLLVWDFSDKIKTNRDSLFVRKE